MNDGEAHHTAWIRFYGDLNDFLKPEGRDKAQQYEFVNPATLLSAIEGLGIPHPEVYMLTANGEPQPFGHIIRGGDRIAVYPRQQSLGVAGLKPIAPPDPVPATFVCDVNLGKLANLLRLLGFDTIYENHLDDPELADISVRDGRILLTRDRKLLMRREVRRGRYVRNTDPEQQAREIIAYYNLATQALAFSRCTICNGLLEPTDDPEVLEKVPQRSRENCSEFLACTRCERVYWQGDHYRDLEKTCKRLLD